MSSFITGCHWSIFLQLEINLPSPAEILASKNCRYLFIKSSFKMCFGLMPIPEKLNPSALQPGKSSLQKEKTADSLHRSGKSSLHRPHEAGTLGDWCGASSFGFSPLNAGAPRPPRVLANLPGRRHCVTFFVDGCGVSPSHHEIIIVDSDG